MVATAIITPETAITAAATITTAVTIVTAETFAPVAIAIMEATEAVFITGAAEPFSTESVIVTEAAESVMVMEAMEVVTIMEAVEAEAAVEVKRPVIYRTRVIEVVPGAGADKHAVHKPVGPVIAVGRAAKRIVGIKTVRADWRRVVNAVTGPDLNANGDLRM
jgi:hypothetical protein